MSVDLAGAWKLSAWRRIAEDGTVTHPLGEDAEGMLLYTDDGRMAVVMTAAGRESLVSDYKDLQQAVGGDAEKRAQAYSTCLAYAGTYEVHDDTVVHRIDVSLFPSWAGAEQSRPFSLEDDELVLRTPPMQTSSGTVVNEIAWVREAS